MNKTNGSRKWVSIEDSVTAHLKDPKNKIICQFLAKQDGYKTVSSWLADIIEKEIIPNKLKGDKTNETYKQF